jgi:DNA-binding CsgD family transcriptional regulator
MLYGREAEVAALDALLDRAAGGGSGALVLCGEPGIGKTALLDAAAARAGDLGMAVLRCRGVESEAELPFAGLHLLLRAHLGLVDELPIRQADVLRSAFGLRTRVSGGDAADPAPGQGTRLLIGIAMLTLLASLAERRPLLCLVDDVHWLDRASAEALAFAARRLGSEGVAVLFATREPVTREPQRAAITAGLPRLRVPALAPAAAAALLNGRGLDPATRYRVLGEAAGNPLALIELPGTATAEAPTQTQTQTQTQTHTLPDAGIPVLGERLHSAFAGQISGLPQATRTLLLLGAIADSDGLDAVLRAGTALGADIGDLAPAEAAGLLQTASGEFAFRHPLVRAAVYRSAGLADRTAAHRALAAVLDHPADADRRAWHLALAVTGRDEAVAEELERTAVRAGERFGVAAAARAYQQAARLSQDPVRRVLRLTSAAEAAADAGDLDLAAVTAEAALREADAFGIGDERPAARLALVLGVVHFLRGSLVEALRLLTDGAEAVLKLDAGASPVLARQLLIQAVHVGWYLGAAETRDVLDRLAAVRAAGDGPGGDPSAAVARYLVTAMSAAVGRDCSGLAAPAEAASEIRTLLAGHPADLVLPSGAALVAGDDRFARELAGALADLGRAEGYIGPLMMVLFFLGEAELFQGDLRGALGSGTEALELAADAGQRHWAGQAQAFLAYLAALAGDEERCRGLAAAAVAEGGFAPGRSWAEWALAVLDLGYGRTEPALARLEQLAGANATRHHVAALRAVPDLVEAAVRAGAPERAAEPMRHFTAWAAHTRQPWAEALRQRCAALLASAAESSQPSEIEACYTASIAVPERPLEQARSRLLYGEWLRREQRKAQARVHLEAAAETFERLGAEPWAARTRAELDAAGGAATHGKPGSPGRPAAAGPLAALTPQELQIVRLAAQGLANKEIAARLFLSPRTVGYHLYKAYPKLGVAARSELSRFIEP